MSGRGDPGTGPGAVRLVAPDGGPVPRATRTGTVVVGSGVAGLATALALDDCLLVTETGLGEGGSSRWAQGGVAAAMDPADSAGAHAADTVAVGGGLTDQVVALAVTSGGPAAIAGLITRGAAFDRGPDGTLALGREAGHSARRIVHADGDATGAEIVATLVAAVLGRSEGPGATIRLREHTEMVDLVTIGGGVGGVGGVVLRGPDGATEVVLADAVVLATGGYAHCFARTTTPREVIGSGVAAAARIGAALADLELVQFHPTALDVPGAGQLPLLTEALRGEGAVLVDETGERYCLAAHPDGELAPRDVVARANYRRLADGHRPVLDATDAVGAAFPARFPTVHRLATANGIDPTTEPMPVTPAAHYCMGGVLVDRVGRTSLPGLWAVGEVTSSGLHGANRLASNSLLEGLVLARTVAADVASGSWRAPCGDGPSVEVAVPVPLPDGDGDDGVESELREILWRCAGVERSAEGLGEGLRRLTDLADRAAAGLRTRTIHTVATLVVEAALARTESRGAHFRLDHPGPDPGQARRAVVVPTPVPSRRLLATEATLTSVA